jgi:hypothetical protein
MFLHFHKWEYAKDRLGRFVNRKCKRCQLIQYAEYTFHWDGFDLEWKNYPKGMGADCE